jgi:hypothetical protein
LTNYAWHFDLPSKIVVNPDFVLLSADKENANCMDLDCELAGSK